MSEISQRGLLVKFDEGVFARLDHETAQRRAANKTKVHRTEVVRSLLKFALDHCARARGETVPEATEVTIAPLARAGRAPAPVVEASSVVMTPERIVELNPYAPIADVSAVVLNCSGSGIGAGSEPSVGASGPEHAPSDVLAEALPKEPEPDPVEVGHVGGIGAIGAHVRTVGVRRS